MIKKILLSSLIGISLQAYAESMNKTIVEAGKPSVTSITNAQANNLILSVGVFDPVYEKLDFNKSEITHSESSNYTIVQFDAGKADSEWLRKQGIEVVSYLPDNAFVVVANKNTNTLLSKNTAIRWSGKYLSNYKISPALWESNLIRKVKYDLVVSFFNNIDKNRAELILKKYLPKTKAKYWLASTSHSFKISISNKNIDSVIAKLATIDAIQYVEAGDKLTFTNTESVSAIQSNSNSGGLASDDSYTPSPTPIWNKNLIGTGQIVAVSDSGLDSNEDWFVHYDNGTTVTHQVTAAESTTPPAIGTLYPDRKVIGYFVQPGAEPYEENEGGHGTHVVGSVAADRQIKIGTGPDGSISSPTNPGYDNDDGMAPNAQILFQDVGGMRENDEGILEAALTGINSHIFTQAYNANARIHSNSWGGEGDGAYNGFDAWADFNSRRYEDMLVLIAAGNFGSDPNTIGSPGNAKNVLTVGMNQHGNAPTLWYQSSRGPTDDNRLKPDIMAPGRNIESAKGNKVNNSTIQPPSRARATGTSMATPTLAGGAALLRQYFTDGFYPTGIANTNDQHTPTGPLMKAALINGTGVDGGHFNNNVGWGRVNLLNSLSFNDSVKDLRVWEIVNKNGLKTNQSTQFKIGVKSGQDLTISLAWYDLPATSNFGKALINDLDLTIEINGDVYKGNVFPSPATSGLGGEKDDLNSVEQIRLPEPVEGIYTITVTASNIPGNGTANSFRQGFALVATGDFADIDSATGELSSVTNLTATSLGDNGTEITWQGGDNADFFEVYRVEGTCDTADFKMLRYVGNSETSSYTDFRTHNGTQYAYKVRSAKYGTLGPLSASCSEITSQQACDFIPTFNFSSIQVVDNVGDICQNKIQWDAAASNCPTTADIKYNVYRSEDNNFTPSSDNLIATVTSTSYDDINAPDTTAYYIISAEDNSNLGTGPSGGNESVSPFKVSSRAVGIGFTSIPVLEDVDNIAIMNLSTPWQIVSDKAADDSTLSYKTGLPGSNYPHDTCSNIVSNTISLSDDDASPSVSYKANYNLEENWDGVVVEISTDDGVTWTDLPPNGGYPGDFSETTDSPVNACGYAATQGAFSGSNDDTFETFTHDLSAYVGQDVKVRWQLSTDPASEFIGFYIDSIQYPPIQTPNACTVNTAPDKPEAGLYYDRTKNGHGFVIEPIANSDLYFTVFYTYKDDGTPEWYTSLSTLEDNVLNIGLSTDPNDGALNRFIYDFDVDPTGEGNPNTLDNSVGTSSLKIDFNSSVIADSSACSDGASRGTGIALATWQLGSQADEWCIEPLANVIGAAPATDFGGTWWTGIDDDGWGLSLSFTDNGVIIATIYYFDANGSPRWVQGTQSGFQANQEITLDMLEFSGYARDATPIELTNVSAGSLAITINNSGIDGNIDLDIIYQGAAGGEWVRSNVPVIIFTAPHK
ncbi:MAG: S8 family serine peptidase [Proteobacteria bacterium]|nr:S8 family serine peptidase [Pseudomonadota bacterium]